VRALITFVSELSYPLYLMHYQLLFVLQDLVRRGVGRVLAIAAFVALSVAVSWLGLVLDRKIPRPRSRPAIAVSDDASA
jgi:peptidoglycan/LPS O-acetylase OafA/YrhL